MRRARSGFAAARRGGATPLSAVQSLSLSDGRTLCVRRRGASGDHPLVLLHGLLDSSEGWSALCHELSEPFLAFDLPGFGHSDAPIRGSLLQYARDIAEALEVLKVKRFTVVGHSLGGAVATALAELMPDRVHALILLAPVGFGRVHLAEAASLPGVGAVVGALLPLALPSRAIVTACYVTMVSNGRLPPAGLVERVTTRPRNLVVGTQQAIRAIAQAGRSRAAFHRRRVGYGGPVTAIWGECDRLVPPSHRAGVLTAFPQARIELWPRMGHHPVHERLSDLAALVATAAPPRHELSRGMPAVCGKRGGQGRMGIQPSVQPASGAMPKTSGERLGVAHRSMA